MSSKKKTLDESELDAVVIAEADDDSAWGKPTRTGRVNAAAFSLPAELAARAAFFARLHRAAGVEEWLKRVVEERLALEEAAFAEVKRELVAK